MFNYTLRYKGLNFARLYNLFIKYGISIFNIVSLDYNTITFNIKPSQYTRLISNKNFDSYDITVIKSGGIHVIKHLLLDKIGIIIGLIISTVLFYLVSNITLNISINNATTTYDIVYNTILDYGISLYKHNDFNSEELELYILDNVPSISMVDVITYGSSIIVNVHETEYSKENHIPIKAQYDMYVRSIDVYSGTQVVFKDSIVRKGDTLVLPYIRDDSGNTIYVEPKAKIEADIWFSDYVEYNTISTTSTKTGNSKLVEYTIKYNDIPIYTYIDETIEYLDYVIEDSVLPISGIIPITIYKRYAYEMIDSTIEHDFDTDRDYVINNLIELIKDSVPTEYEIIDKQVEISKIYDKYYIVVYLKCSIIEVY